jgi:hypothetical protein
MFSYGEALIPYCTKSLWISAPPKPSAHKNSITVHCSSLAQTAATIQWYNTWQFNVQTINFTYFTYMQIAAMPTMKHCRYFALPTFWTAMTGLCNGQSDCFLRVRNHNFVYNLNKYQLVCKVSAPINTHNCQRFSSNSMRDSCKVNLN